MSSSVLKQLRVEFHQMLLKTILTVSNDGISSIADKNNRFSVAVAKGIVQRLGGQNEGVVKAAGQTAGNSFESTCRTFIDHSFHKLLHLRPGAWSVVHLGGRQRSAIASFEQYVHLEDLARILSDHSELAASLGQEYTISPDIVVFRNPYPDDELNQYEMLVDDEVAIKTPQRAANTHIPFMHASISCKWTLRSDRAQNARSEALNLLRNRKGRAPHIVVITAEPTPSRISSLALGTGDLDCVYHFALPELIASVASMENEEAENLLKIMVDGKRLRDIADLPLDLLA